MSSKKVVETVAFFDEAIHAVDLIWNNKYAEAEAILVKRKDHVPRHAIHYSEVSRLQLFF